MFHRDYQIQTEMRAQEEIQNNIILLSKALKIVENSNSSQQDENLHEQIYQSPRKPEENLHLDSKFKSTLKKKSYSSMNEYENTRLKRRLHSSERKSFDRKGVYSILPEDRQKI